MKLETLITYAFRIHINLWVRSFWRDWLSFVNVWVKCEIMCESFMGNVMLEERCVVTCHKINGLHANSSSIVDIHLVWTISSYKRNFSMDSCFLTMYTLREYKLSWIHILQKNRAVMAVFFVGVHKIPTIDIILWRIWIATIILYGLTLTATIVINGLMV